MPRNNNPLEDDALAEQIAAQCHDPAHDDRWCPTCAARQDAIEDYRRAILDKLSEAERRASRPV